jgi:GT2 family glycosyltransferase
MAAGSVGVIVPVHGWAPYLAETLDGLLAQRPAPDVLLVVDDGSPQPLRLHPEHCARCTLLRLERRHGLAAARAAGLAQLDTDFVALCDGDDAWEPGSLAARVEAIGDAALCFGRALIVGPDNRPTGERWDELQPGAHDAAALRRALFEHNPICVSSALVRRETLLAAGGFDSELSGAADWELWLRLLRHGASFVYEPRAVVRYRRRAGGMSANIAAQAREQLILHERHAALVDEPTRVRVRARDLWALGAGLVREGRYAQAREALAQARALAPPSARERALEAALRVPGVRSRLGRRDPYRR